MLSITDNSRQSLLRSIRWRPVIILTFCLGLIHFVILAPELRILEAGHKLISAAPTWSQIVDQVSWGKELPDPTQFPGDDPVTDVGPAKNELMTILDLDKPAEEETTTQVDVASPTEISSPSQSSSPESSPLAIFPPEIVPPETGPPESSPAGSPESVGLESASKSDNDQSPSAATVVPFVQKAAPIDGKGHPPGMDDGYAAICISIKDQRLDLVEFLTHHYYHLGIRYFYIMDDGSIPPLSEMEDFGIPRSALSFTYQDRATRAQYMQMAFYDNCLKERGALHHWIAFFDADEFLEITSTNETFREILESFEENENVAALGVSWRMHSSAGLLTRPDSARKAFTTCIYDDLEHDGAGSDNRHIKSIVRPSKTTSPFNPHKFAVLPGTYTLGEKWDEVTTIAWRSITRDRIALHHYAVKSKAEYDEKVLRGNGMTDPKSQDFWDHVETMPHVDCPEMAAYNP